MNLGNKFRREFEVVFPDGIESTGFVEIVEVFDDVKSYVCTWRMKLKTEVERKSYGVDAIQSLCLAIDIIDKEIELSIKRGVKITAFGGGDPYLKR